jgi:hypothetical protein
MPDAGGRLPLPGMEPDDECALHFQRGHRHEGSDMFGEPYDLRAVSVIKPLEASQVVGDDPPTVGGPRQHCRRSGLGALSLRVSGGPPGRSGKALAWYAKYAAPKRKQREPSVVRPWLKLKFLPVRLCA